MNMKQVAVLAALLVAAQVSAQVSLPTTGTLVIVPAAGQVTHVNDEATAIFSLEETGRDKVALAAKVNQRMKQGADIIRAQDPTAKLKTQEYYTLPQYRIDKGSGEEREIVGWKVGQSLQVRTQNLAALPKTSAAAQGVLGLKEIRFHLSQATAEKLDHLRIAATYANLNGRIASIAAAMGRKVSDATLETVDFAGMEKYSLQQDGPESRVFFARNAAAPAGAVAQPDFEPGETTLQMQLVGKVKFK